MADQDPYAATAIRTPAASSDPYAATAVGVSAAPPLPPPSTDFVLPSTIGKISDRERFLNPDLYAVGVPGESVGENLHNIAQRGGVGVFQLANAAAHPRQTVASILASILPESAVHTINRAVDLENKIPGAHYLTTKLPENVPNPVQQAYQALQPGGWRAAGNAAPVAGQALAGEAFSIAAPKIARDVQSGAEATLRATTDTGSGPVKRLVAKTQAENEKIGEVNADRLERQKRDQAQADADYRGELLKLRQKYEKDTREADQKFATDKPKAEEANANARREYNQAVGKVIQQRRAVRAAEEARANAAAQTQVIGSQLIYRVNQLDRNLRARADTMYNAVREKVGNASLPGTDLRAASNKAAQLIQGSSTVPPVFRDIASKYPESDPEFIEYQGARIPKSNRLYDILKANGAGNVPPVSFADLQGYYSELGKELSKGTLPGDVYQATRALQDSVGDMMQKLADGVGVGKQLASARKFYRDYMDAFHEPAGPSGSGSPVAQVLLAKDPAVAIAKFTGNAGDRGVAILRRYDDNLASLAQRARAIKEGAPKGKIPVPQSVASVKEPKLTPVPTGPSRPLPPVLPEAERVPVELKPTRTISKEDIANARQAAANARADFVSHRGMIVATWPIFQAMRAFWGGHIPSIPMMGVETAGSMALVQGASKFLRYPPMLNFLTKARPRDIALIPPELRGDLPGLVSQAQRQGIKVAPALIVAAANQGRTQQPIQQPALSGVTQ